MLCTDCGKLVRPVVALDIDGTLGDYHGHFLEFARMYMGLHKALNRQPYHGLPGFKDWFIEEYKVDERTWRDIKLAYRQGAMKRSMPAYYGATELASRVQDSGAELWLTTTRPYQRLDNIDPDTRFWLAHYAISYDGLLYDERKYERLAESVDPDRVVAVIEDLPELARAANRVFGPHTAIMSETWYNSESVEGETRSNLILIAEAVENRVNTWIEARA